jgi:RND superfamily putative drug exporter
VGLIGGLGRACYRHRVITLLVWVAAVASLIALWTQFGAAADNSFTGSDPGQAILDQHFARQSGDALTLAITSTGGITSPATQARVTAALRPFAHAPHVTSVANPYTTPGHVSPDRHVAFATVQFDLPSASIPGGEVTSLMNDARAASGAGVTFSLGGDLVDQAETPYGGPTEGIGVTAAAIVLLIAFGSLLAMGLPVATALLGIGAGLSLIALLGHVFPAPSFSPIIASLIGLGVGVDYALFIVTRFREGLRSGADPQDAAVLAMRTAGRSVLTAGTIVVIGMFGLFVLRQSLMNGVAVAAAATVAMTVLASLTLLPALLGFTGTRLAKPSRLTRLLPRRKSKSQPPQGPAAERWAGVVQRHPVIAAVTATAIIAVLAAPALGMKLNMPDESTQGRATMGYASYAAMARGFGPGFDAPLIIAATLPGAQGAGGVARLADAVRSTPGVARVTAPASSRDGKAVMLIAYPATSEQNPATNTLVNQVSGTVIPHAVAGTGIRAYVTGPNAANVTFANQIGQRLPWLIAIVVGLAMVLLLVVFRSVVIAIKAAVMNLLSITAAYGVLVMVAQHGWLRGLFGFPETMPVTTWVPMFLFVILFGLSMDYEVFLLSRIREFYDASGDNARSVARGLASTARVISAAAAIMVVVFLSNVLGADVSVKQIGLGLAVAVFVDATVVRLVLVPAVMELLGAANWWLPRPLARLLPCIPHADGQGDQAVGLRSGWARQDRARSQAQVQGRARDFG